MFMVAVCLAQLALHAVAVYGMLEATLGYAEKHLYAPFPSPFLLEGLWEAVG